MTTWYMAHCDDCGEHLDAHSDPEREAWAEQHHHDTEHVVRYWSAFTPPIPGIGRTTTDNESTQELRP